MLSLEYAHAAYQHNCVAMSASDTLIYLASCTCLLVSLLVLLVFQGVLRAFKGQLIHTFNKREGALTHAAAAAAAERQPKARGNVLLLGDSLGDLTMADGVSEQCNLVTIGFLNDQVGPGSHSAAGSPGCC